MTVLFHSDDSVNKKGFKASWKALAGTSSGEVTSPNYPAKYPHNHQETKIISVPEGKTIELTFTYFAMEAYVVINEEQYQVQIIKRIVVDDSDFQCIFDLSYSKTQVDLPFSSVTCDGYYDIENVEVVLSAPNGYEFSGVITIFPIPQIVSMVIDNAEPLRPTEFYCPYDKLEIFDGAKPSDDNKSYTLCGVELKSLLKNPIISKGNTLHLKFSSDGGVAYTGYRATWKAV